MIEHRQFMIIQMYVIVTANIYNYLFSILLYINLLLNINVPCIDDSFTAVNLSLSPVFIKF